MIKGSANTASATPANLKLVLGPSTGGSSPGVFETTSDSAIYATLYAPQSAVKLTGNGDFYGSILGWSVEMSGTSAIHYDLALGASSAGGVSLVR